MAKKLVNFRFDDETLRLLQRCGDSLGISKTAVLETALRYYVESGELDTQRAWRWVVHGPNILDVPPDG